MDLEHEKVMADIHQQTEGLEERKIKAILAIDYDGTVAKDSYPGRGTEQDGAFETLRDLKKAGYALILWTCREGEFLLDAVNFCKENGVHFDSVNSNMPNSIVYQNGIANRKIFCHIFIDDRNLGGFPGWSKVRDILL